MSRELPKFNITIKDFYGRSHVIGYELEPSSIAESWYHKIHHLHRLPLDRHYTRSRKTEAVNELQSAITKDLLRLKDSVSLIYPIKESYDQEDCNLLHSITVATQYDHDPDVREIFHRLHRTIHKLEDRLNGEDALGITVGWGEKEGLLRSEFDVLPYDAYQQTKNGYIYLCWSEFGKTPYQYWRDHDSNDPEHFFQTCKPHRTFRALFVLALETRSREFPESFDRWFDQYREEWESKYGCGWLPLYEWGGVPLGRPLEEFDWAEANTVLSIALEQT